MVITGVFAAPGDAGNDSLVVYGQIKTGDHDFDVFEELDAQNNPIDLIGNENVQPDGAGVKVGSWTFFADNQLPGTSFQVAYTTSPLVSDTIEGVSYAFEVIEIFNIDNVGYDNKIISFAEHGSLDITQGLAVKLLAKVPEDAAPANDFKGSIVVTLTTIN